MRHRHSKNPPSLELEERGNSPPAVLSRPFVARDWIEAKLYWGGDLQAVTYTAAKKGLVLADLGLPELPDSGDVSVEIAVVPRDDPKLPRTSSDGRVRGAVLAAAALHAVFAALAFHGRAPPGEEEASAHAAMLTYAAAIDARSNGMIMPSPAPIEKGSDAPKEAPGAAGNPARTNDGGRMKETRGAERHASNPEKGGREDVSTFGMLALVAADHPGENAGSSPWAKDLGPSAMGNMFGATIDDAAGNGGLGLSGNGEGGGGKGTGIAFGGIDTGRSGYGTCGGGGCGGRASGHHIARSPVVRCLPPEEGGCTTQVNGRLPPEAVQRVVRASFGRFRGCYEQGLLRDPGLEGRIATKFVISRDGSVAMVSVAESSLSDASVAKCVERAFYNLTFPEPEGGIVTVVYPIVLSTSP
jgi:hypothetical protein